MKPLHLPLIVLVAVAAGAGGWFAARQLPPSSTPADNAQGSTRKVLYYQSAMHPWIKSDKPGRCTICGMALSPVFEGDKGFDTSEGVVTLGSNSIQVINVQSQAVKRRPLQRSFRFAGTIDDNDAKHRIVSAYVDGRIDTLVVNHLGAEVVAGEPLATLYSPMLLAAEREYVALQKPASAGAATSFGAEQHRLSEASAARLERLGLSTAQIAALPQKDAGDIHTPLLAPMSGTVVARFAYEGQYVKEGEKLFEIADFSTMWFLFDAYERDLAWLRPGQKVEVTTPSAPGRSFAGTIAFIDPNLKEMTRSAKVRVELLNPLVGTNGLLRRELYHKLFAEALVQVEMPELLAVPRSAVLSPGANPVVYVDKGGGAYEQRKVRLGRVGDEFHEVLEGLGDGERVVTQGSLLIDAQAQLNAGVNSPADAPDHGTTSTTSPATVLPAVTAAQQPATKDFLAAAAALSTALAADDLAGFNTQATRVHTALPALLAVFTADDGWRTLIAKIEASGHLDSANDLKTARKNFHPLSVATVEFAKALRRAEANFGGLKVFRCPMTKDAFPGAPRTAEWLQLDATIRNPWFGAEMLDCGNEVK